jgi:hypothetical protein
MESPETSTIETSTTSTRSVGIRFGLIAAGVSIAYFLILNVAGINMADGYWNWIGYAITIAIVYLAHKHFKENTNGYMSYGQGFGIGLWIGLVSAAISSVFTYIYVKFVDGTFLENIKEVQIAKMQEKNMTDEQIEQAMKFSAMFMSPEAILIFGLIGGLIGTMIIALIVSIFTQKKSPETAF